MASSSCAQRDGCFLGSERGGVPAAWWSPVGVRTWAVGAALTSAKFTLDKTLSDAEANID